MKAENEKIIEEFTELLNIPAFKKVLLHKIEELKILLSEDIGQYKELKTILDGPGLPDVQAGGKKKVKVFQLNRLGESLWIPSLVPHRKGETGIYHLLPEAVIDYIVSHKTEPGLIVAKPGVTLPELPGRRFDLYFERPRENFISGVINETECEKECENETHRDPQTSHIPVHGEGVDIKSLRSFFDYLVHYPVLYNHMINQFELMWKPLIDRQQQKSS
jgi:hypothetical protein